MVDKLRIRTRIKKADVLGAAGLALFILIIGLLSSRLAHGLALVIPLAGATFVLTVLHLELFRRAEDTFKENQQLYAQLEALVSVVSSVKLRRPLPPMRGWAISPDLARILVLELLQKKPEKVMELGSGASTILIAACLRDLGRGKLWSIEQAEEEARRSLENLKLHGLTEWVEVVIAPLQPIEISGERWMWYDVDKIPATGKLDLLLIDGPSYPPKRGMRYPAMPILGSRLSDDVVVIVDDAGDALARHQIERWLRAFPGFLLEWADTEKGTALLRGDVTRTTPRQ